MKKVIALMLGLVAGTASFAQQTTEQPQDIIVTTFNQKLQVYMAPETSVAIIKLQDEQGHLLYNQKKDLAAGLRQSFNLTQLEPGTYRLSINKDGQTLDRTVVVESIPAQKQVSLKA